MRTNIEKLAFKLRLPNIRINHKELIEEALNKQLSYESFIELLLTREVAKRGENSINKKIKEAKFPTSEPLAKWTIMHLVYQ